MTPRERAIEATWDTGAGDWTTIDRERLETRVEQAINAAVAEEREACAKIASGFARDWKERCERENSPGLQLSLLARIEACKTIAEYIRARSNPAE